MPLLILDAVPGEVQEQKIVALSLFVEAGYRLSNLGAAFVAECDDVVELTDCRRREDPLERINIHIWSLEAPQVRIVVTTVADNECEPASHSACK